MDSEHSSSVPVEYSNFDIYHDQDFLYDDTETVSDIFSLQTSSTDTYTKRKQESEIWNFFKKVQWGKKGEKNCKM